MPNKMDRPDKQQSQAQPRKGEQGVREQQGEREQQGMRGSQGGQQQGGQGRQGVRGSQGGQQGEQIGQQGEQGRQGVRGSQGSQVSEAQELDGTERARDEQRQGGGPRYGGGAWSVADERGNQRFGHARNDDADPSELAPGQAENDDDESPSAADPELAAAETNAEIESGGQRAGFGRGEKPRKGKSREQ